MNINIFIGVLSITIGTILLSWWFAIHDEFYTPAILQDRSTITLLGITIFTLIIIFGFISLFSVNKLLVIPFLILTYLGFSLLNNIKMRRRKRDS